MLNPEQRGETLKSLFCYITIAILPIVLYSYRFLPKVETINILNYTWDFNGFPNSYSFLFAALSKLAPLLFILIFYLDPRPIKIFRREIKFKNFLFPTLLIYFYQLIFIVAPVDKIDEGFYSEVVGWSIAFIMSCSVLFSNQFFIAVSKMFNAFYLLITFNSLRLKLKVRGLISFIVNTRSNKSHKLDQKVYDEEMWDILEKTSK